MSVPYGFVSAKATHLGSPSDQRTDGSSRESNLWRHVQGRVGCDELRRQGLQGDVTGGHTGEEGEMLLGRRREELAQVSAESEYVAILIEKGTGCLVQQHGSNSRLDRREHFFFSDSSDTPPLLTFRLSSPLFFGTALCKVDFNTTRATRTEKSPDALFVYTCPPITDPPLD